MIILGELLKQIFYNMNAIRPIISECWIEW